MNTQDKDQSGAAVRGEAVAETATDQLYGAVMNIPCKTTYIDAVVKMAYKEGHRDARHAAADLIAAFSSARAADAPSDPSELAKRLRSHATLFKVGCEPYADVLTAADALDSQPTELYGHMFWDPLHPDGEFSAFMVQGRDDPATGKPDWQGHVWLSRPLYRIASSQPADGGVRNG
jgi:hypothetical protein